MAVNTNEFRHTLIDNDRSLSKVLEIPPDGWEDFEERIYRHEDYHGVLYEDTTSLNFIFYGQESIDKAGGYFLLAAYENKGVKADVQYKLERLNRFTNSYELVNLFQFDFDPKGSFIIEDEYITIATTESSKVSKFLARDEIDYNLFSLKSSDNITVPDFINSYKEALYKKVDIYLNSVSSGTSDNILVDVLNQDTEDSKYLGINYINEIGDRLSINDIDDDDYLIYTNNSDGDSTLKNINLTGSFAGSYDIVWRVFDLSFFIDIFSYDSDGNLTLTSINKIHEYNNLTGSNIFNYTFNVTINDINISSGGYCNLFFRVVYDEVSADPFIPPTRRVHTIFTIDELSFYEETDGYEDNYIRGLMAHEVLTRELQLMTSETNKNNVLISNICGNVNSEFQTYTKNGFLSYLHFTNGYQLRQFTDRAVNCNFKSTFKSLFAIKPIGIYYDKVNDIFVLDDIDQFYKNELMPFVIEEVKDLKRYPASNFYFNSIETGYPKIDFEDFSGVNEVNTETSHQISIETKETKNLRSDYHGSTIFAELARRKNISDYASEDTKFDSEINIIKLNSSYQTEQGALIVPELVNSDQYYNLELTPRQNLKRQLLLYQAALFKDTEEVIQFVSSEKDTNISYNDSYYGDVNEFDDLTQFEPFDNYIKPEFYEMQIKFNYEMMAEIKNDPHRIIQFIDKDEIERYGYLWELSGNPYKGTATLKLIRLNENRLL